jgi:small subunit ribosomal protein S7
MTEKKKVAEKKEEKAPVEEGKEEVKEEKKTRKRSSKKEEPKVEEPVSEEKKPRAKKAAKKEAPKEEKAAEKVEEAVVTGEEAKEEPVPEEKEEVPGEEIKEIPVEEKEEAPAEEIKEIPVEEKEEAPAEEIKEIPVEEKEEAPKEESPEAPDQDTVDEAEEGEKKPKKSRKKGEKGEEGPFPEDLMFGKYNSRDIVVEDPSLKAFINLDPALVPHSSSRHANKPFHKHKISIVERLINNLMRTENYTGKKAKSYKAVLDAFILIEKRTKENPIQVLVRAIENSAPREEVTRLKFGGISVPKAVDTAPARRLDIALRNISIGTVKATHKNRKSVAECLASELIAASKGDIQSFGVSKRDELERVAKSAH